jgi:hypothetical protein
MQAFLSDQAAVISLCILAAMFAGFLILAAVVLASAIAGVPLVMASLIGGVWLPVAE